MLISVHMPKTGGLSFRAMLEEHFGGRFAHDYGDYPLAHSPEVRRQMALTASPEPDSEQLENIDCVHGHFLPVKYQPLASQRDCTFVTWLREPVTRLVSHYLYWQRTYDPQSAGTSVLHKRVMEEGWSLEDFCLAPELRNIYTQFLWSFPLQDFDFIGITEYFDEDFRYFCTAFLGNNLQPRRINQRDEESPVAGLDAAIVKRISDYHAEDVALYLEALRMREGRVGAGMRAAGS
ncbi:MAG: sulfotransferase family 2 domain-containing protein [Halioglobus sp.]